MNNIKESEKLELHKVLIEHIAKTYDEHNKRIINSVAVRIDNTDERIVKDWMNDNSISDVSDEFVQYVDMGNGEKLIVLQVGENTKHEDFDGKEITFNDLEPGSIINLIAHAWFPNRRPYTDSEGINLCMLDNIKVVRK